jgi:hypothetical protein
MSIYKDQLIQAHNLDVDPSEIPLRPRPSFIGRLMFILLLRGIR